MRRRVWPEVAALAAIQAAVLVLWYRFNQTPPAVGSVFPNDFVHYYYPLAERVAGRLAHGELPLWNPFSGCGLPLLATTQVGVFYPGNWLWLVLPADQALVILMAVECSVGGFFAYGLFRVWGNDRFAAVLGAVLFVFACLLGLAFWPPALATLTWLPWILLCIEKLVRQVSWRWSAGLAVGVAMQALAGFPQFLVYTFYLAGPFAALRLVELRRRAGAGRPRVARVAMTLLAAVGLGALLAGVQLVPTWELVTQGVRSAKLTAEQQHYLGTQTTVGAFVQNAVDPGPKSITIGLGAGCGYVGIASLLLAAVGAVARRREPLVWVLAAVGALGLVLSQGLQGWASPFYDVYRSLPTGAMFRTPERLQVLPLFALITLATFGFARLTAGGRQPLVTAAVAAVAVVALGTSGAWWRALIAFVLIVVALRRANSVWWPRAARGLLIAVVVFDVLAATERTGSFRAPPTGWARTFSLLGYSAVGPERLGTGGRRGGATRIATVDVAPDLGAGPIADYPRAGTTEPLPPRAWQQLAAKAAALTPDGALSRSVPASFDSFQRVASVGRVLRPAPIDAPAAEMAGNAAEIERAMRAGELPTRKRLPGLSIAIVERDPLPRAYVVPRFEVMPTDDALDLVLSGGFPFDEAVILDTAPASYRVPEGTGLVPAEITAYDNERVELELDSPGGMLVLTDTFYPGWHASVDGKDTTIHRANGLFRAVRVPAGRCRVVFEYSPASVHLGAILSALAALCLLGFPLLARRSRKYD